LEDKLLSYSYQALFNDYLLRFPQSKETVNRLKKKRQTVLDQENSPSLRKAYQHHLAQLKPLYHPAHWSIINGKIKINSNKNFTNKTSKSYLEKSVDILRPWKKGPYQLFHVDMDTEWRSNLKWERLESTIIPLVYNSMIADVGCHNGYFIWRMLPYSPKWIIGFEPCYKYRLMMSLLQGFIQAKQVTLEGFYLQDLSLFPAFFDLIFCLGVLYHCRDPITALGICYKSLKKGGYLVIDSQGVSGETLTALCPKNRYAGASGVWFLPTWPCLENWLRRIGFHHITLIYCQPLSIDEQRTTSLDNIRSLQNFLNKQNKTCTIEGYPAPWRFYVIAKK